MTESFAKVNTLLIGSSSPFWVSIEYQVMKLPSKVKRS
jgi:hypothetical protein